MNFFDACVVCGDCDGALENHPEELTVRDLRELIELDLIPARRQVWIDELASRADARRKPEQSRT